MNGKPTNRWFRFSLRTLLLLVTALCTWLGWESSVVRARRALLKELNVNPAFTVTTAAEWSRRYPTGFLGQPAKTVPFVRRRLGDEAIQEIGYYKHFPDAARIDLKRLARVFPEAALREDHPPLNPCHPGCFPRGTLVDTPRGQRPIETIQAGERLTAILTGGETVEAAVTSVFVTTNRLWQIETEAGSLVTTEIQPLCLATDRALPAGQLQPGDTILHGVSGALRPVRVLSASRTDRIEQVFNLVLSDSEAFLANGFLARSKPPAEFAEE
jgi:hypothetical protein